MTNYEIDKKNIMKEFEEFKQEILRRAKSAGACVDEYTRALKRKTFEELMRVIKDNFGWCCINNIIYEQLINDYKEQFNSNEIYLNESRDSGFLFVTENLEKISGNCFAVIIGDAVVNEVCGNATIDLVCNNAKICNVFGNAVIKYVFGNAVIERVYGKAVIKSVCENAVIESVSGKAVIERVYGKAVIKSVCENAVIESVSGKAVIESVSGKAVIERVYDNAVIESVYDNARILHDLR